MACRKEEVVREARSGSRAKRLRALWAEENRWEKIEGISQGQTGDKELFSEEGGQAFTGKSEITFLIGTSHRCCALVNAGHQNHTKVKLSVDPSELGHHRTF